MLKKYSLAYNKDHKKLTYGVYKGDRVYYGDYNDRFSGLEWFGDFDEPKEIEKLVLDAANKMIAISPEMINDFINNFVDYNPGYFTLASNEKVYKSTVRNKYNVTLDANNPILKDYTVKNLNKLYKRNRNNKYVLPIIYSNNTDPQFQTKDNDKDIVISSLCAFDTYKSESDTDGWKYSITLDGNGDVSCYIGSLRQGRPISLDSFLNEDKISSAAEYYCQEGFLEEFNRLIELGVIVKK